MPRADRFQPTEITRTPKPSPADYAQVPGAIARAGAGLSQVAGQAFGALEAIERAERLVRVKELQFMYRDAFEKKRIENLQQTDYSNFEQRAADDVKEIQATIDEAAGDDEKLRQAIDIDFKTNAARHQNLLKLRRIQELEKSTLAIVGRMEQENMVAYANSATLEDAALIRVNYFAELDALALGGTISPNQIQAAKTRFDDNAEDARVEAVIQADPDLAIEMINAGEFDLDPKEKQTALNRARAIKKQRDKDVDARKIRIEKEQKRIAREQSDAWEKEALGKLNAGTLTFEEILTTDQLDDEDKRQDMYRRLESKLKADKTLEDKDSPWKVSDPVIEAEIIERLGEIDDDEIMAYSGQGLSVDDTLKYLEKNRAWKKGKQTEEDKKLKTPAYKEATSLLKLANDRVIFLPDVDNEDDLTDEQSLQNRTLYAEALKTLQRQVQDPDNVKSEIEIANEILKPYFEKESAGAWEKFKDFFSFGKEAEEDVEKTNIISGKILAPENAKRQQAIEILEADERIVNEDTIKLIMDQLP